MDAEIVVLDPTQHLKEETEKDTNIIDEESDSPCKKIGEDKPKTVDSVGLDLEPELLEEVKKTDEAKQSSILASYREEMKCEEKKIELPMTEEATKIEVVETANTGELPVLVVPSAEPQKINEEEKPEVEGESVSIIVSSEAEKCELVPVMAAETEFSVISEEVMKTEDGMEILKSYELPVQYEEEKFEEKKTETEFIEKLRKYESVEERISIVVSSESTLITEEVKEIEENDELKMEEETASVVAGVSPISTEEIKQTEVVKEEPIGEVESVGVIAKSPLTTETVKRTNEEEKPKAEEEPVSVVSPSEYPVITEEVKENQVEEEKTKGEYEPPSVIAECPFIIEDVTKTDEEEKPKPVEEPISVVAPSESPIITEEVKKTEEEEKSVGEVEAEFPLIDAGQTNEEEKSKAHEKLVSIIAPSESFVTTEDAKKTEEEKPKADERVSSIAQSPFINDDVENTEEKEKSKAEKETDFFFSPPESLVITEEIKKTEPEEESISVVAPSEPAVFTAEVKQTEEEEKPKVEEELISIIAQSPFTVEDLEKKDKAVKSKAEDEPLLVIKQSHLVEATPTEEETNLKDEKKQEEFPKTPKVEELKEEISPRAFEFKPVLETEKRVTPPAVETEESKIEKENVKEVKTDEILTQELVEVSKLAEVDEKKDDTEKTEEPVVKKQSNSLLGKMKQTLVKAKKAIIGKSPNTKTPPTEIKGEIEA